MLSGGKKPQGLQQATTQAPDAVTARVQRVLEPAGGQAGFAPQPHSNISECVELKCKSIKLEIEGSHLNLTQILAISSAEV